MAKGSYSMRVHTRLGYEEAVDAVLKAFKAEGFGLLTEIDVRATLKEKLGVDFKPYVILGTCNPALSHRALQLDEEVGVLLPCNVVVYEGEAGVVVSAMDPDLLATATGNPELGAVASEVRERLARALKTVGAP